MTQEKVSLVHSLFRGTVFVKGISGVAEIILGGLFLFVREKTIYTILLSAVHNGAKQLSSRMASQYVAGQIAHFSLSIKYFIAAYFLFYGIVNIFFVIFLIKEKWWAYPAAITCFSLFTCFMVVRFLVHQSGLLLCFIFLDIFLICLTWLEYRRKHPIVVQDPL